MTSPFDPNYVPQIKPDPFAERNRKNAARTREKAEREGSGWGTGTIPMPGTPKTLPPKPQTMRRGRG